MTLPARERNPIPGQGDLAIGFLGTSAVLRRRVAVVESTLPDAAIVRLPLERIQDANDVKLLSSFASACNLIFVDLDGVSDYLALPAIVRSGTAAVVELPTGFSLGELRNLRKLSEEARVFVGVSRPLRQHPSFVDVAARGKSDFVWADVHAAPGVAKAAALGDFVDLVVELVGSRSVQRIDSKTVSRGVGLGETLGISIRFQNTALALIRFSLGAQDEPASSIVRCSGGWGEAEASFSLRPFTDASIDADTTSFLDAFLRNQPMPSSLSEAFDITRIVEQIMARLRQHDSLAI